MAAEEKKGITIEFVHEFAPEYRLFPANGIWGGVTTRGDLRLDFFVETHFVPNRVVSETTPEGKLGKEIERVLPVGPAQKGRAFVKREFKCGILISTEVAKSFADFIYDRLKQGEKESE